MFLKNCVKIDHKTQKLQMTLYKHFFTKFGLEKAVFAENNPQNCGYVDNSCEFAHILTTFTPLHNHKSKCIFMNLWISGDSLCTTFEKKSLDKSFPII